MLEPLQVLHMFTHRCISGQKQIVHCSFQNTGPTISHRDLRVCLYACVREKESERSYSVLFVVIFLNEKCTFFVCKKNVYECVCTCILGHHLNDIIRTE